VRIETQAEELALLAERAIYWPRENALIVADIHFGKAATFRSAGIPVPEQTTQADLDRITKLIDKTRADHLIILGDLIHAKMGKSHEVVGSIAKWRAERPQLQITLIRGNHDRVSGTLPDEWNVEVHATPLAMSPFLLAHEPDHESDLYVLAGHIHPSVRISDGLHRSTRLPCFSFGERRALLPAFGSFTGSYDISPSPSDRIYVIADREIIKMPGSAFRNG
jgi:uncharacterized protein